MTFDEKKYNELVSKRDRGEAIKPAEKAAMNKWEREQRRKKDDGEEQGSTQANSAGSIVESEANAKSPKNVRFAAIERRLAKSIRKRLLAENSDEVKNSIGSLKALSEDIVIRAAVLSLERMPTKKLLAFIKAAKMND